MSVRCFFLALSLSYLILLARVSCIEHKEDELDEDLDFLQEDDDLSTRSYNFVGRQQIDEDAEYDEEVDNYDDFGGAGDDDGSMLAIEDKDVLVLKERNFTTVIENNEYVMVEFYAPWCGHCQALAPEYAAAATELKGENVVLAKVDATEETELAHEYDVQGFPTVLFFVDGVHKTYKGQRTKDAIVTWVKKNIGPGVTNITTLNEAEQILTSHSKVVLALLNSLVGSESREFATASKLDDDIRFYQTVNEDVAKMFHIDPTIKRPATVLLKQEIEKLAYFNGNFVKSEIADFVFANKLPLVTTFTREVAPSIFDSPIKKQVLLFASSNNSEEVFSSFQGAAKFFKGKLIFIFVRVDDEEAGKPVTDYFGITGSSPKILAYTGNEDGRKFVFDGEMTLESMTVFAEGFLEDKLKPFYKSDPIPDANEGDVKIVVGNTFDEIVLDESKDVLLEIYAPWCGHCQTLEPIYSKLAKNLRGIESIIIAKMDGTTNEHPRAKSDGFPTILFFPAGKKSFDPVTVDAERTVVALYKFLKKHASIPFKLQRPSQSTKVVESSSKCEEEPTNPKDEL